MKISLQQLPPLLEIKSRGEVQLLAGKIRYTPWNSESLYGKVRTIIHLAGRSDAFQLNQELIGALQQQAFDTAQYQTTTIINLKDAAWGTGTIMCSRIEQAKKEDSNASFVIDEKGAALKAWGLSRDSSAVILLDEYGEIIYGKDGVLGKSEVKYVIDLLHQRILNNPAVFPSARNDSFMMNVNAYAENFG